MGTALRYFAVFIGRERTTTITQNHTHLLSLPNIPREQLGAQKGFGVPDPIECRKRAWARRRLRARKAAAGTTTGCSRRACRSTRRRRSRRLPRMAAAASPSKGGAPRKAAAMVAAMAARRVPSEALLLPFDLSGRLGRTGVASNGEWRGSARGAHAQAEGDG